MSATETTTEPAVAPRGPQSLGAVFEDYRARIRGGDVGALPALAGVIVLVLVFTVLSGTQFTNAFNFANLVLQGSAYAVFAMGLVFVLLLGEIDLSAGYTGGVGAAVVGKLILDQNLNWVLALIGGLLFGALVGLVIGLLVSKLGVPSFVVTLAFFLALQGVLLLMTGAGGTIPYRDSHLLAIMNKNMPLWLGWAFAGLTVIAYAALGFSRRLQRQRAGLPTPTILVWVLKSIAFAAVLIAATAYLSKERSRNVFLASLKGVPIVIVIVAGLLVVLTFLLTRTAWGRHVYAVGGNAEAARRAGINVARVKISCFMMCSMLASVGGVLLASRTNSVNPQTGGSDVLLFAVGSAVIGGTSLFGGRGRVLDGILGAVVITVIVNGMTLQGQSQGRVYMITGLVLLLAASVDAVSRRRAAASGRV
ncbi:sugar ABC transporter permease [Nocardioides pocheonensis]|uniref:Xylose transport system permease protein XylH n=1 Tax=Nocardioides pocheonensis TaxID=661485 RepID=A0A3N0GHI7_9ACTN|nr:ABC transporter permease [Nocardioides pocheonensis]RNM11612.1 ABC transporter permease [Nocardioides pocheonensis]